MKILIAYYSRTGETEKAAESLESEFKKRGHSVSIEKVKPAKEHSSWSWFLIRMFKGECPIKEPVIKDVSDYDAICFGSPNWTRLSLPMARYLREIEGLKYKKVGFFSTTFLWPPLEWYIFSAYLLDLTFSTIVEKKGGRVIDSIMFSSYFKKWEFNSEYGKNLIKKFCDKVEVSITSFKEYALDQKEVEGTRLLIIIFSSFLFLSFIYQGLVSIFWRPVLSWPQYLYLLALGFITYLLLMIIMQRRLLVFLGKYLVGVSLAIGWTLMIYFLTPILGRPIILGYVLLFIFISFFRELKTVLFTGLVAALGYLFLFFNYSQKEVLHPGIDLALLFLSVAVISFITQSLQRYYLGLLETQEDIEKARASLEEEVAIRTKELRELAGSLDEQVKQRTKALQEKVEELEKFHRLAVGRELKMIALKEEIEKLKKKN